MHETAEIIRILEEEQIDAISTTHDQRIDITLKDGRHFHGSYVHAAAGKYADDESLSDILNLVLHIQERRPSEDSRLWKIMAE